MICIKLPALRADVLVILFPTAMFPKLELIHVSFRALSIKESKNWTMIFLFMVFFHVLRACFVISGALTLALSM